MCKGLQATRPSVFPNIGGFGIASRQHEIHKRQFENEFIIDEEQDSLNAQYYQENPSPELTKFSVLTKIVFVFGITKDIVLVNTLTTTASG